MAGGQNFVDLVGYDDIRVALGLSFKRPSGLTGLAEVGYAFNRDLEYRSQPGVTFQPDGAFFVRGSLNY